MRCPRCGNEVSQEEVFCGQCGAPTKPPARPTQMMNPSAPGGGLLSSYGTNAAPSQFSPRTQAPASAQSSNIPPPAPSIPYQPPAGPFVHNQQAGFHQDATEAMTVLPGGTDQGYPPGYPQQNFSGMPAQGQYGPQPPLQPGNYGMPMYPPQAFATGQGYEFGKQPKLTPPPEKRRNGTTILFAGICFVAVLIGAVALTVLFMKGHSKSQVTAAIPTIVATTITTPTLIATPTLADTPTLMPSPTLAATPAPDAGFLWCVQVCNGYGFTTEYPRTWQPGAVINASGVQFANPTQADQSATFKAGGPTTSTAGDLVAYDLQTNFAAKPNYAAPTSTSTTTISGETWVIATTSYKRNKQQERVEVYATVHQGKAYIIELQAPESLFETVNTQYFIDMLGQFQFLQNQQ
ncbi:MAG: zinc-ribbon domain-containing protein [Chloroflexi bacterium]|nr:zinc-ribbon domain-containing protein [Chloroflexota bacterium]